MNDHEEQENEMTVLQSMFDDTELEFFKDIDGNIAGYVMIKVHLEKSLIIKIQKDIDQLILQKRLSDNIILYHLPKIELQFRIPIDYPSKNCPLFTVVARWLPNRYLNAVCLKMEEMWKQSVGQVILYNWINFLKMDTLSYLNICDEIDFTSDRQILNSNAVNFNLQTIEILKYVIEYDKNENEKEFFESEHDCAICFESICGKKCFQFLPCNHTYCKNCISTYFQIQIDDGNVHQLLCPTEKCQSEAHPNQVKNMMSNEQFERYERLLLKRALENMENVYQCPRTWCSTPVLFENEENYEECPKCHYVFCRICKKTGHGVNPCQIKTEEMLKIYRNYMNGSEKEKLEIEKIYGKTILKKMLEDSINEDWLINNSKKCPGCQTNIQKSGGCNRILCWKCNTNFCWLCNQTISKITPYLHFTTPNSPCFNKLFIGLVDDEEFFD